MKFFKRHKITQQEQHPLMDAIAVKIFKIANKLQSGFASFMNRKLNSLSLQKQKIIFMLFVLLTASLSGYYIVKGIWSDEPNVSSVKIVQINFPKYEHSADTERIIITEKDYQSIIIFRHYMDRLYISEEGKHQYDSILQARPGLMDSVQMLEQIYLSQQKH